MGHHPLHHTGRVVALEANKSLIDTASKMARESRLTVAYPSGGARSVAREVSLDGEANPERITFKQCDPMCLPAGLAGEEVVASGGWVWLSFWAWSGWVREVTVCQLRNAYLLRTAWCLV